MPRRGSFVGENLWEYIARVLNLSCNLRVILDFVVQVERELFSFFASFFLFSKESGESPLTLRPNFKSEKGSVTAAAAACLPRRGSFVGRNKASPERGGGPPLGGGEVLLKSFVPVSGFTEETPQSSLRLASSPFRGAFFAL